MMDAEFIKSIRFHIKSQDYFGTLATVLSLNRQNLEAGVNKKQIAKVLERAEEQLIYLQKNYKIVKIVRKV
jgi:hypothetical protein